MTLIEMMIVGLILGAGLFLMTGWMNTVRQAAKRDLAVRMLTDLDQALARYYRACNAYPASYGETSALTATLVLLDHDRTRSILEALPPSCWREFDRRTLVDPWGTPLRYYATTAESPLIKANGGRPLFVSAGPDRDFGDKDPARVGDNLRSDDPGPAGFRLHHVMRDTLSEMESDDGEIDDRPGSRP